MQEEQRWLDRRRMQAVIHELERFHEAKDRQLEERRLRMERRKAALQRQQGAK